MKKLIFSCLALVLAGATAFAEPVCFSDKASYQKVKDKLPASMRSGALYLVHKDPSSSLVAAAMITPTANGYSFQMAYDHNLLGTTQESGVIKKVCINGNQAQVTLASGTKKNLNVQGLGFTYKGYKLVSTSREEASKIYKSIVGTTSGATGKQGQK